MAKLTVAEEQLLERITDDADDHLRNSLGLLRQAAEDIWATDAPRIMQDFTSHGIDHSKRVAKYAAKLLETNNGHPLSSQESYLLLAGIYLHDIGMQCDVVEFPEIKKQAEGLGVKFDVEFTAETSNGYSIDEQKAIRKNHQYLTAAWIDYAQRSHNTALGLAAQSIPSDLVTDLIHVCMYHSKLPINECPITFKSNLDDRKQLVAALLRFSDELDVGKDRVSIETVKNFRLDPNNAVYWWLHNLTRVVISDHNAITLTILLNPDDHKQYSTLIHEVFITRFQTKNKPVITILRQNDIPVTISAESGVVEDQYIGQLPREVVQLLPQISGTDSKEVVTKPENLFWVADDESTKDTTIIDREDTIQTLNPIFIDVAPIVDNNMQVQTKFEISRYRYYKDSILKQHEVPSTISYARKKIYELMEADIDSLAEIEEVVDDLLGWLEDPIGLKKDDILMALSILCKSTSGAELLDANSRNKISCALIEIAFDTTREYEGVSSYDYTVREGAFDIIKILDARSELVIEKARDFVCTVLRKGYDTGTYLFSVRDWLVKDPSLSTKLDDDAENILTSTQDDRVAVGCRYFMKDI